MSQYEFPEKNPKKKFRKKKHWKKCCKKKCLISLLLIFLFVIIILCHCLKPMPYPPAEIWFEEEFEEGLGDWEYLDAQWIDNDGAKDNTSVKVARDEYLTPNLNYTFDPVIEGEEMVIEFYMKLEEIPGATTLASLDFSTGEITAVIDGDGYLGLSFGLFEPAQYSTKKLKVGEWEKIQIYINTSEDQVSLYHNDLKILTTDWSGATPLLKIWLGTVWLYGAENYQPTSGTYYDAIRIGNTGLLKLQTLCDKIRVVF